MFSGIGGFDLAAEWMGWENVFHCEWNEFGQKVLKHYWPDAELFTDITKADFTKHANRIDVLTGGFPCQPYSAAGSRKGKEDDRHLWPEMLRAIREIKPRWVVGENVYGLVNWGGGLVFNEVQTDLEAEGYEVLPVILPACAVNAPHRRDRVWFVAYAISQRHTPCGSGEEIKEIRSENNVKSEVGTKQTKRVSGLSGLQRVTPNPGLQRSPERQKHSMGVDELCKERTATNTSHEGLQRREANGGIRSIRQNRIKQPTGCVPSNWENFPTQRPVHLRDDGVSNKLLIFVVNELYEKISNTSKENRIENLQEVWGKIQSPEVWEQIRGLYSLESEVVLFKTMQLYSPGYITQIDISPFGEELCRPILRHLQKYGEFRCSPQGQKLQKQRSIQFGNSLSFLPHEVALAARRFEAAISKFEAWHRNESIKAYGNAVVPQLVFKIFQTLVETENALKSK